MLADVAESFREQFACPSGVPFGRSFVELAEDAFARRLVVPRGPAGTRLIA